MSKSPSKRSKTNGTKAPRRSYERTTPVGRVVKHVEKALRIASFASDRMATWDGSTETSRPRTNLVSAQAHVRNAVDHLTKACADVRSLHEQGWVPPKKSMATTFAEGEEVMISEKYREKYLQIYSANVIDNLTVAKCLDTGEIAVRHGSSPPFMVAKSHVEKRRAAKVADKPPAETQASR